MQTVQKIGEAELLNDQGAALYQQGKLDDAIACYHKALTLKPNFMEALCNQGNALKDQGQWNEAVVCFKKAIGLSPDLVVLHFNLAIAYQEQGDKEKAIATYLQAVKLAPGFVDSYINLGILYKEQQSLDKAVECYGKALMLRPNDAEIHNNLGNVYKEQEKLAEARACYERALELNPNFARAYYHLAVVYSAEDRVEEAIAAYQQALTIKPDFVEPICSLANILRDHGYPIEATASYRQALAIKPDYIEAHTNLIFCLDFNPESDLKLEQQERQRWAEVHAEPLVKYIKPHNNKPDPERRLRLGYVSADLRRHSAACSFGPMILSHNRSDFELVCYSGNSKEDDYTARFRQASSLWRSTVDMSDADLANLIYIDKIDILVDLSGYAGQNRLLMFARKPTPIQVTAWGHATGTGLSAMDYLFSDAIVVPDADTSLFAEEVIHLPCATAYLAPPDAPEVATLPASEKGVISFGCFNRTEKISSDVFSLWAQILLAIPRSQLVLKSPKLESQEFRNQVLTNFSNLGIEKERLILLGKTSHHDHLDAYKQVDIALDTFPGGGGVTTLESIWMGVPVIALHGERIPGRIGPSILNTVGLKEFVADSLESYKSIAINIASDVQRLAKLRDGLRSQMASSVIGDPKQYVPAVEKAYRDMWRRWCSQVKREG